ncbi:MAG: efflux RND transporter periplasmic adaptor subunit [Candidatus Eremiobacteraeota bacterium]|nr:efflux RND transporter periplasmic adaptor subunit [Candidatus Eremiobacteraeota bacterium]MBV8366116.1 efflux RND transporter periplasmic adaptor subunit [Candidatus Eremiobacteraeota bacterium]
MQRSGRAGPIALAVFLLAGCGGQSGLPPAQPVPVKVAVVERKTVPVMVQYVAHVQAVQEIALVPRVEGTLEKVSFKDGSLVHQGQLLMQIQQEQYLAQVEAAQGQLDKAQADLARARSNVQDQVAKAKLAQAIASLHYALDELDRVKPLVAKHAISIKQYDQSKTQVEIAAANVYAARANLADTELNQQTSILTSQGSVAEAQAQLTNAKLQLSYTTIYAPVTGIISFVDVDQGNYVSPAKTPTLATLSTIDPIKCVFQLSETDYLRVAKRLLQMRNEPRTASLNLYLSDGSRYPFAGTPESINRAVDQQTGTISIESTFPNPQALLRPGQFGRVEFPIALAANALLVPRDAVQTLQGTSIVYVVGPGDKLQLRSVAVGSSYGDDVIIQSGVKAGETVVVEGGNRVQAGAVVKPQPVGKGSSS